MADLKDKQQIIELIKDVVSSKRKEEKSMDLDGILKSNPDPSVSQMLPLLYMMSSNNSKSGGLDKFVEVMGTLASIQSLTNMMYPKDNTEMYKLLIDLFKNNQQQHTPTDIESVISKVIDSKLSSQQQAQQQNNLLLELIKIFANPPQKEQKNEPSVVEIIKLVSELMSMKGNNDSSTELIDKYTNIYEKLLTEKQKATEEVKNLADEFNDRLLTYLKENKNNPSVIDELTNAAQTVNGIKEFAKNNLGLKDFNTVAEKGEETPTWKLIMEGINQTLATVLPVMSSIQNKPPKKQTQEGTNQPKTPSTSSVQTSPNPTIEAEANRLYEKYKQYLPQNEVSVEDFKQELEQNPNLEKDLEEAIKQKQSVSKPQVDTSTSMSISI